MIIGVGVAVLVVVVVLVALAVSGGSDKGSSQDKATSTTESAATAASDVDGLLLSRPSSPRVAHDNAQLNAGPRNASTLLGPVFFSNPRFLR